MKKHIPALAAVLVALLLIIGVSAAPVWWFGLRDEALSTAPLERLRRDGPLSPEAEELYLVRTLNARDSLLRRQGAAAGYEYAAVPGDLPGRVLWALDEMAKAGALPAALRAQLQALLTDESAEWSYAADASGFELAQCLLPPGGEFATFGVEMEPATRCVVRLWLLPTAGQSPALDYDEAALLEAYKQWLGLGSLDDWRPPAKDAYAAQQQSDKGLLQLYADTRRGLVLGVAVVASKT